MISKNHAPTARQRRWHAWLAEQECCNCGSLPVCLHHCAGASAKNEGVWIGQDWVLPLCYECHQGAHGIHADRLRFAGEPRKEAEKHLFAGLVERSLLSIDYGIDITIYDVPPTDVVEAIFSYHK